MIQKDMEIRVLEEASYYVAEKSTIRKTAKKFMRSHSTVYLDLTKRIPLYSTYLANEVLKLMETNKRERSKRGGDATKQKFLLKKHHTN